MPNSPRSSWDALFEFFGLSNGRNKLKFAIFIIIALCVFVTCKVAFYGLTIVEKFVDKTIDDNARLRLELKEKDATIEKQANDITTIKLKYFDCMRSNKKIDTLIKYIKDDKKSN